MKPQFVFCPVEGFKLKVNVNFFFCLQNYSSGIFEFT